MAQPEITPRSALLEEAVIPFCSAQWTTFTTGSIPEEKVIRGPQRALRLGGRDPLALFQQLRGIESQRSFLREVVSRFFSHLFPGVVGLHPSSFHRGVRKLRFYFEPLRRAIFSELIGEPETLIVDSTLLFGFAPQAEVLIKAWVLRVLLG
jgi:hypothetical protein